MPDYKPLAEVWVQLDTALRALEVAGEFLTPYSLVPPGEEQRYDQIEDLIVAAEEAVIAARKLCDQP